VSVKPGRNDPCPCGSGKKFKKCCQGKLAVTPNGSAPVATEINQLVALFTNGRYAELERRTRILVALFPNSGYIWKALGTALQAQGKDALPALRKAAKLLPHDAEVHNNLGGALCNIGQLDEALASYHRAVAIKPHFAEAHNNLGNALRELGRLDEAVASYRRALEINPGFAEAHNNLGAALHALGQLDEAVACFHQALQISPDLTEAHNNLGAALHALGQLDEAVASYHRALEIKPDFSEAHNNLGGALMDLGQREKAMACYRRALEFNPSFAEAHNNLGCVLGDLGQLDEAIASCRRALQIKPGYAGAHRSLGRVLIALGKMDDAERFLTKALELGPNEWSSLSALLSLVPYRPEDPRFNHLDAVYDRRGALPPDEQIKLNFAMGKAMESIGQYDRSFNAYEEGNRLHYIRHPFDETKPQHLLEMLCAYFTSDLFKKVADLAAALPVIQDDRVPIFIVGMPRSGTTLIEQMLASHPSLFGAGELNTISELASKVVCPLLDSLEWDSFPVELRKLGREYIDEVWKLAPNARYITDKMPGNYQYLGLIHLMLPNAKIIHSMRDPMDTCFSCYALRFKFGHEYSYDLETLGRQYLRYRRLMAHWRSVLPEGRILDVRYEDNVADPEREARRLLEYLGLPWDPACLNFHENKRAVLTPSAVQVRKPIYSSSVARWKHYETHLGPLLGIIHPATMPERITFD
jgi:tetratricopeptide (TPR) repeat protein